VGSVGKVREYVHGEFRRSVGDFDRARLLGSSPWSSFFSGCVIDVDIVAVAANSLGVRDEGYRGGGPRAL
jgi:hypothetical protein